VVVAVPEAIFVYRPIILLVNLQPEGEAAEVEETQEMLAGAAVLATQVLRQRHRQLIAFL
jgi:hypothetical protein